MRLPRELDAVEIRVIGSLLEKEQTTPDAYPLSVNALVGACNQKSNRDPVMRLSESDIEEALDRLHAEVMVWPVDGARTRKWRHSLDRMWELTPETRAVMAVLLLRGAQTVGEIRGRSERMHAFGSTDEVERALESLASSDEPLTVHLARQPGQKEARWTHLVGGEPGLPAFVFEPTPAAAQGSGLAQRVSDLENRVARLEEMLEAIDR
jgi:uncharacterized protein YceH (UPF0502 family)